AQLATPGTKRNPRPSASCFLGGGCAGEGPPALYARGRRMRRAWGDAHRRYNKRAAPAVAARRSIPPKQVALRRAGGGAASSRGNWIRRTGGGPPRLPI